jgi:hypothetical protein
MPWKYIKILPNNSSRHQIACFKATEGLHPSYRAAICYQYSVASFATVRVLSCLHSHGLGCSCCNVVRFFCDLEACNLVTATAVTFTLCFYDSFYLLYKLFSMNIHCIHFCPVNQTGDVSNHSDSIQLQFRR